MRIFLSLCVLTLSLALAPGSGAAENQPEEGLAGDSIASEVTMITVYDNYQHDPELRTGWGFSCLIEADGRKILFDTGADGSTLLHNMEKLGIDPKTIDAVVLSHAHGDHADGLMDFLRVNPNVRVFLLKSFPGDFKKEVQSLKAEVVEVIDSMSVSERVSTTGELGTSIKEQSLLVKTSKGVVVITGCAHPGIVDILKHAKKITGEEVYLVLGGFHLLRASELELKEIIKSIRELGVKKAAPCHCSGDQTRKLFQEEYQENFIANGVGMKIEI
jgi:7,8-dihydropterin-6-yl-methyl-4-(beta-D-ribofuranosyl)aminobenzene 5'-phosphate synthase